MTIQFHAPCGPAADEAELQYLAALLQTQPESRVDGTVHAVDVQHLLLSRHGLAAAAATEATASTVASFVTSSRSDDGPHNTRWERLLLHELAGSVPPDNDAAMDVVQLVAVLLIPELLRIRADATGPTTGIATTTRTSWTNADDVADAPEEGRGPVGVGHTVEDPADDTLPVPPSDDAMTEASSFSSWWWWHAVWGHFAPAHGPDNQPVVETPPTTTAVPPADGSSTRPPVDEEIQEVDDEASVERPVDQAAHGVFQVLLEAVCQTSQLDYGVELTVERVQGILQAHGEEWPTPVVHEMMEACREQNEGTPSGQDQAHGSAEPVRLDVPAFVRGLTSDVQQYYDISREDHLTTHYQDALAQPGQPLERLYTAPSCDSTADTYRSFWWTVLAWGTLVAVFFAYFVQGFGAVKRSMPELDCATAEIKSFGCHIVDGIIIWLEIFLELSFLGTTFLFFATWGNSIYAFLESRWYAVLTDVAGIVVVFFVTVLSYVAEVDTPFFNTEKEEDENSKSRYWYALILGSVLLVTQLLQLVRLFVPLHPQLKSWMVPGALVRERWIKQAARLKVRRLCERALACHSNQPPLAAETPPPSLYEQSTVLLNEKARISTAHVLLNYQAKNEHTKPVGGILWVWKCIFNQRLMKEEGIWISPTLVSSQIGQWLVVVAVPFFFLFAVRSIDEWNIFEPDVKNGEIAFGMTIGAFVALVASISTAIVYLPSAVSQLLQFRTGVLGSLHDPYFQAYRIAPDKTAYLFGSSFWGIFFLVAVSWAFVGVCAFLVVWHTIRELVMSVLAGLIGICTTILFKMLILRCLRTRLYAGLYRRKPAAANLSRLVLECWNLGLSSGYIIARSAKLVLLTVLYLGRIDTPFLAPGIGWVSNQMPLDHYPIDFRKDLLLHEAHRHPYIERLGLLCMLKLRHGSDFGSRAGAAWRILFALSLAPWMQKYRQRDAGHKQVFFSSSQRMELLQEKNVNLQSENQSLQQKNKELTALLKEALAAAGKTQGSQRDLRRNLRKSLRSSRRNFGQL